MIIAVTYQAKSGQADTVAEALTRMAALVAEREPGCLIYQISRSNDDDHLFLLYEQYVDAAAFDAHCATEHFADIIQGAVLPLLDKREPGRYTHLAG